jgi:olfactory receptor
MYFFLSNVSLVDCVYALAVTPKVMVGFLTGNKIISYNVCATQMSFASFVFIESSLVASMSFDHHAAVCKPLHYTTTMTDTLLSYLLQVPTPVDSCNFPSILPSLSISVPVIPM